MKVRAKKKAKKQSESIEILVNKLINKLINEYGFEMDKKCRRISIWAFDNSIEIEQLDSLAGFKNVKCKRKEVIK